MSASASRRPPLAPSGPTKGKNGAHEEHGTSAPLASLRREPSLPALAPQSTAAHCDFGAHFGLDIGGTLTKMAFLERPGQELGRRTREFITSRTSYGTSGERDSALSVQVEDGTVHFLFFSSSDIVGAVELVGKNDLQQGISKVYTAGGGAFRCAPLFQDKLGVELVPADELDTVVRGISWLAEHVEEEVYVVQEGKRVPLAVRREGGQTMVSAPKGSDKPQPFATIAAAAGGGGNTSAADVWRPLFPMLVVNIGTGVSIIRVTSSTEFERVSGTAVGGGTYWGLCQLLTGCRDFDEAAKLASEGDASEVNLEVRDIYGGDYTLPNGQTLPGSITASFFAKAEDNASVGGVLRALVTMIAQNVCQIALLNTRIHEAPHVVFTGNFLRQNPVAIDTISTNFARVAAVMRANGLQPRALFLRHEGYFGALGSLLQNWQTEEALPQQSSAASSCSATPSKGISSAHAVHLHPSPAWRRNSTPQSKRKLPSMSPPGRRCSVSDGTHRASEHETPASPKRLSIDMTFMAREEARAKMTRRRLLAAAVGGFAAGSALGAVALFLFVRHPGKLRVRVA